MPVDNLPNTNRERQTAEKLRAIAASEDLLSSSGHGWQLLEARRFHQPATTIDIPFCDSEIIAVLYKGAPYVESWVDGQRLDGKAEPRHMCILPARTQARIRFHSECEILHIYLNSDLIGLAAKETAPAYPDGALLLPRFLFRDPIIGQVADRLTEEMKLPGLATHLFAQCMAQRLTIHLLRHHSNVPSTLSVKATGLPEWKLRRVLDYIEDHLDRKVTLTDLAELVEMSIFHFVRCFKQSKGVTPHQYVMRRRMEVAKALFQDTELDIGQVTLAVGLHSQSHFAGIFQRHAGMTPARFRRLVKT